MSKTFGVATGFLLTIAVLGVLVGTKAAEQTLAEDQDAKAQAEVRKAIEMIVKDAESANIEGLQASHLDSKKFTKFGPRSFERQDRASTNQSEAAFFGSISNYKQDTKDLKVDVFGDVAIATYYPHASFVQNGNTKKETVAKLSYS